jgi:hypothetical protein
MSEQPPDAPPRIRFGVRSLLVAVSLVCLTAGLFRMLPLAIVIIAGAFLVQLAVFQLVLRLGMRITGGTLPDSRDSRDAPPDER